MKRQLYIIQFCFACLMLILSKGIEHHLHFLFAYLTIIHAGYRI